MNLFYIILLIVTNLSYYIINNTDIGRYVVSYKHEQWKCIIH